MIAKPQRVLFICHNHPSLHPGGSEILAHDLFRAMKAGGEVECLFLGCVNQHHREQNPGTCFQTVGRSADELLLWTGHFDHFSLSQIDLHGVGPELTRLLEEFRPDVVHFHHALLIGIETLFLVRRVLPEAALVFTLHDYYAICAHLGQMVTAVEHQLCRAASADACARCFPDTPRDRFLLREKHIKAMFGLVDRFIAPSAFLRRRYIDWGLPAERIEVLGNGRPEAAPAPHRPAPSRRDAFATFGNASPFKGTLVALRAMAMLEDAEARLTIHGGMPFQDEAFTSAFAGALAAAGPSARHLGAYAPEDLPALMAKVDWVVVPSIWWENAPLVILEAFRHRRPVICSGIGGMAEMVADGVNGLHFHPGDPASLSEAMRRAIAEPGLWESLVAGIPEVPTMAEAAASHRELYRRVLDRPGQATRRRRAGA